MNDFWLSCGHHLLDRSTNGRLLLTDEFLKVYLARPELVPPAKACAAERALFAALLDGPRRLVSDEEVAAIADEDARENWRHMIAFRDHLLQYDSIEAAYLALIREAKRVPPLFLDQLVHLILRNVLDAADDAYLLRAAEMLFRPQRLTFHDGSLIAADDEHVGDAINLPLLTMLGVVPSGHVEVLNDENASTYWERSDRFDLALDLSSGRRGRAALAAVLERWLKHLSGLDVAIEPLVEPGDLTLSWYVGLDAVATRLGDALWRDGALSQSEQSDIIVLYRLTFADPRIVIERLAGEPIYLILAMTAGRQLRMKPQNLLTGLPIRKLTAVP